MLIIMGTSLKVHGLKKLVKDFARSVHSTGSSASSGSKKPCKVIFVNKTAPGSEWSDIIDCHISGETDAWTTKVIEDWKKMRPTDWEVQQTLVAGVGETSMSAGLQPVKSRVAATVKAKNPSRERENVAPPVAESSPTRAIKDMSLEEKPVAPLSPSKRRQKSSHYDDVNSSPSKRQSTHKNRYHVPEEERKMLFTNTTNIPSDMAVDMSNSSKMSITLADLSIREDESKAMDISLLDISMKADESVVLEKTRAQTRSTKASKSAAAIVAKIQPSQRRTTVRKVVRERKPSQKKEAIIAVR